MKSGISGPRVLLLALVAIGIIGWASFRLFFDPRIYDSAVLRTQLVAAIRDRNAFVVSKLLRWDRTDLNPIKDSAIRDEVLTVGSVGVAKLLLQGLSQPELDEALGWSVTREHADLVRLLLDRGASPDGRLGSKTILYYAARGDRRVYEEIKAKASDETIARSLKEAEEASAEQVRRIVSPPIQCADVNRYAEARGKGFFERAEIEMSAKRGGLCE